MIYSFAVGCLRDAPAMYRQTDTLGALTQAAPRASRINAIYFYLCVSFSPAFHLLFPVSLAWLKGWTGGGGEKQLDGTNDVTNNTSALWQG